MAKAQTRVGKGGGSRKPGKGEARGLTRRQRRLVGWVAAALAVVLVGGVGGYLWQRFAEPLPGEYKPSQGNDHIESPSSPHIPYNSDPPTSGPHLGYIAPWGIHSRPIPKELQVHNLEDGGVVVNYNPECADRVLDGLKTIVGRYADHVVLAPYPGLDACIALTAWARIDKLEQVDERRIVRFIDAYRGIDHHKR
jgi:hypothetical protein